MSIREIQLLADEYMKQRVSKEYSFFHLFRLLSSLNDVDYSKIMQSIYFTSPEPGDGE